MTICLRCCRPVMPPSCGKYTSQCFIVISRHSRVGSGPGALLRLKQTAECASAMGPECLHSALLPAAQPRPHWLAAPSIAKWAWLRSRSGGLRSGPRDGCSLLSLRLRKAPDLGGGHSAAALAHCALGLPPCSGSGEAAPVPPRRCSLWTKWRRSPRPMKVKSLKKNQPAAALPAPTPLAFVFRLCFSPNPGSASPGSAGGGRAGSSRGGRAGPGLFVMASVLVATPWPGPPLAGRGWGDGA